MEPWKFFLESTRACLKFLNSFRLTLIAEVIEQQQINISVNWIKHHEHKLIITNLTLWLLTFTNGNMFCFFFARLCYTESRFNPSVLRAIQNPFFFLFIFHKDFFFFFKINCSPNPIVYLILFLFYFILSFFFATFI